MAWTREQAREIGRQKGGRPKGSRNKAKLFMSELATSIVTDSKVQATLLAQARAGTLPPRVMIELFHFHGGRPPMQVELPPPPPDNAELVDAVGLLSADDQIVFAELSAKVIAAQEARGSRV